MFRALVFALGLGLIGAPVAEACSCLPPDTIFSYQNYDHSMIARAISSAPAGPNWIVWTFEVVKDLKGCERPGTRIRVATASNSAACGTTFTPGLKYLLFAADTVVGGQTRWTTNSCAGNKPVTSLTADEIAYLRNRPVVCGGALTCTSGQQPVNCLVDPCQVSPACPGATCESNYCGGCNAEWYDPMGYGACMPW